MIKLTCVFLITWFGSATILVLLFNEKEWDLTRIVHHTLAIVIFMYLSYVAKAIKADKGL
tara:strand:+ start:1914 stop:2093 length:180 start_codon:yes stop_codon:yes gene_type:complete